MAFMLIGVEAAGCKNCFRSACISNLHAWPWPLAIIEQEFALVFLLSKTSVATARDPFRRGLPFMATYGLVMVTLQGWASQENSWYDVFALKGVSKYSELEQYQAIYVGDNL